MKELDFKPKVSNAKQWESDEQFACRLYKVARRGKPDGNRYIFLEEEKICLEMQDCRPEEIIKALDQANLRPNSAIPLTVFEAARQDGVHRPPFKTMSSLWKAQNEVPYHGKPKVSRPKKKASESKQLQFGNGFDLEFNGLVIFRRGSGKDRGNLFRVKIKSVDEDKDYMLIGKEP